MAFDVWLLEQAMKFRAPEKAKNVIKVVSHRCLRKAPVPEVAGMPRRHVWNGSLRQQNLKG
jgi:hypothetical protein